MEASDRDTGTTFGSVCVVSRFLSVVPLSILLTFH